MHSLIALRKEPLSLAEAAAFVHADECGGTVYFVGSARPDELETGRVIALEYEAYGGVAERKMVEIAEDAYVKFGAERVVMLHRTGRLTPGEAAVIVAAAAGHRTEAFQACAYLIDEIKLRVPIWKKEWTAQGGQWVVCTHSDGTPGPADGAEPRSGLLRENAPPIGES